MGHFSDYFGVLTYIDPLIYYKPENHSSWKDREYAVKRDIFLKKYICQLDAEIFQELPIFVPDILGSDKSITNGESIDSDGQSKFEFDAKNMIAEEHAHILPEWEKEHYSALFIRLMDAARTHKWCFVQQYSSEPYWRVFTYREVKEITYSDQDLPISAKVMWAKHLPLANSFNLHEETINFASDKALDKDQDGEPVSQALFVNFGTDLDTQIESTDIEHIWSIDVNMRYIMLNIVNNSARSGGFYWLKWGSQVDDSKKEEIEAMFEKANSGNAIGATESLIADMQAMFMKNPEFPVTALDKFLKLFSGACNLPLIYFNGEKEEGSIFAENTGAMAQVNDKKKALFGKFKEYFLKLVEMRWGITCEDVFPNLEEEEEEQYSEDIIDQRAEPGSGAAEKQKVSVKTK